MGTDKRDPDRNPMNNGNYIFNLGVPMCDTKADAIPAAAGAPEDEIEITPEMIEAGALAFYGPDWGLRRPFGFIGRCGLPLRLDRCSDIGRHLRSRSVAVGSVD